ncbi:MAG TPA: hypothetical protein VNG53_03740, partial [Bacteroidia bacterium]|nr:hypothetical protein [Bacteroidia bacterium]
MTSLPIFITKGVYGNASGFTQMPPPASSSGLTNPVGIVLFHYYNTPSGEYAFYLTLNHELGHCLGLLHTYYNSCCPENNCVGSTDFMSDLWNPTCYATSPSCYAYEAGSWSCTPPSSPYNAVCTNNGAGNTNALTSCSNNIMGGTQAAGHISAMQMGKMHRTLALQSTRQYVQEMNSSHTQWIVNSDETWDFDMEMYQDIFVTNGATLTIKCKVEMADLGRIIVDRGSRLIINGGTVTATWKMWNGIELWGTSTQNQTVGNNGLSPYQGIVSIINGGTVTNAHNGITTIKDVAGNGSSSDWDWAYTGGIIQC